MSYFYIFDYKAYIFLSSKVYTNKLVLYSKLIILIRYKNNDYCFICHIQGNIILYSIHAIFDEKLFSQYTNSHAKEYKLYNKLLDKISLEIELLVLSPSEKDGLALVPIPHIHIPPFKNPTVEIEEDNDVDSDVEI